MPAQVYLGLGTYYSITRPLTDKAITQVMVRHLEHGMIGLSRDDL